MVQKIKSGDRVLSFTPAKLINGQKIIDRAKARENLLLFRKVMVESKINWGLIWGTLLGAIRENDFIAHDEDIDVFVHAEEKAAFIEMLFKFDEIGLKVIRFEQELISLSRNDEYIDINFFREERSPKGRMRVYSYHNLPAKWIETTELYEFQGEQFPIPSDYEKIFVHVYGQDWRIPKQGLYGIPHSLIDRVRYKIPPWVFEYMPQRFRVFLSKIAILVKNTLSECSLK